MEFHQVLGGTGSGDAVFTEAQTLRTLFRQGCRSDIYAPIANPGMDVPDIRELARNLERDGADDTVIIVHALEDPLIRSFVETCQAPMVLRYHNITPAEYFKPWDALFAKILEFARRDLAELHHRFVMSLAVSTFNAEELIGLGYTNVAVVPIVTDMLRHVNLPSAVASPYLGLPAPSEGPVITLVSRIAPNKGHVALVHAFAVLRRHLIADARLVLVGVCHTPRYRAMLDGVVRGLRLDSVIFTGQVGDEDLAAIYRRSGVFVSLSGHEGFGIPSLESFSFGVPVIAWRRGAVSETLGDAAILLDDDSPELVAEAIHLVLTSSRVHDGLSARGHRRLEDFRLDRTARTFVDALAPLIVANCGPG